MNLRALERRAVLLKAGLLEAGVLDENSVQALALGRALDELDVPGQSAAEVAIDEYLNLQSVGFEEAQIADMMGERWNLLADLEKRALQLLPEVRTAQATLYRRRYRSERH